MDGEEGRRGTGGGRGARPVRARRLAPARVLPGHDESWPRRASSRPHRAAKPIHAAGSPARRGRSDRTPPPTATSRTIKVTPSSPARSPPLIAMALSPTIREARMKGRFRLGWQEKCSLYVLVAVTRFRSNARSGQRGQRRPWRCRARRQAPPASAPGCRARRRRRSVSHETPHRPAIRRSACRRAGHGPATARG